MQRLFCVYKHINTVTKKVYIGITSRSPKYRWGKNGNGYLRKKENGEYIQPLIARAILKYGWEAFEHIILFEGLSKAEAKSKEIELIAQYKSRDPNFGYNISAGGEGNTRYATEEELAVKQALKKARDHDYYLKNKEKIRQQTAEYRKQHPEIQKASAHKYGMAHKAERAARTRRQREKIKQDPILHERYTLSKRNSYDLKKTMLLKIRQKNLQNPNILTDEEKYRIGSTVRCDSTSYLTQLLAKFDQLTV
jgi:group I intron endonuclease